MTALEELRAGQIGEEFVALLAKTIRAVALSRGFPPPPAHNSWGGDALTEAVNDFLACNQTPRRLTDLCTHCRTDRALNGRLERTVRNFLADRGRRTPVGRLVLRFNEVLKEDPTFERRGAMWALAGTATEPGADDLDALTSAVAGVEVVVPTAWESGDRQSPDLDANSVVRVARAALEKAGGPLRASVLAQAAARRLGIWGAPLSLDATAFDPSSPAMMSHDATDEDVLVRIRANEILVRLNDHERVAIGLPEIPVAGLGHIFGCSRSKAALIRNRAVAILQAELQSDESGSAIADAVLELARTWTESWTM